jgi:mannose/fructose/N-acetylgalactosamine-specific phosphotransferase system component IIC
VNRGADMENKFDLPTIIAGIFVAGYAAMLLEYVALDDLGFSTAQIRHLAMIGAALVGMSVAIGMLRSNRDRTE